VTLFETPSAEGHEPWLDAIAGAKTSIEMTMFHITDPDVVSALASRSSLDVRIIVDGASLTTAKFKTTFDQLASAGIEIRGSSPAFSITHEKAMVVDGKSAFITTMNLTKEAATTRDWGIVTTDAGVIAEMHRVFEADWTNAANGTGTTPTVTNANLLWSPVNSEHKLVDLIHSAKSTIVATVENLGDTAIQNALAAAAAKHIDVRIIVPECDINANPLVDYPPLATLSASGVQAHVMPHPASVTTPYMHAKTLVVDGHRAYVGSVNYSTNSTTKARELGVVVTNANVIDSLTTTFEADWAASHDAPNPPPTDCPLP
jgi:cardiolipin synthase A/B